jgi:hypothetical protein
MTIGLYAQVEQQADRAAADQLGLLFMPKHDSRGTEADTSEEPSPGPDL